MGAGDALDNAMAMACTWTDVSVENWPMPPRLLLIADWIRAAVAPRLLLAARAPWQPLQSVV